MDVLEGQRISQLGKGQGVEPRNMPARRGKAEKEPPSLETETNHYIGRERIICVWSPEEPSHGISAQRVITCARGVKKDED